VTVGRPETLLYVFDVKASQHMHHDVSVNSMKFRAAIAELRSSLITALFLDTLISFLFNHMEIFMLSDSKCFED
jgi:hypothetical protein